MNILFIGDIVGRIGRQTIKKIVPRLRKKHTLDLVIANAENAAHGSGVTETIIKELMEA
ncbi:MAG: YmdB family metallophosphoesterase, partial [Elusimicrobiales bacterium]|nr:YmdB family metallophosphoesterase [Elusimicrobiales bacterium]